MTSSGTNCSFSQLVAQMPSRKPNRQKVSAVSNRNTSIQNGCSMCSGTKKVEVSRMIRPIITDLVVAAPT